MAGIVGSKPAQGIGAMLQSIERRVRDDEGVSGPDLSPQLQAYLERATRIHQQAVGRLVYTIHFSLLRNRFNRVMLGFS